MKRRGASPILTLLILATIALVIALISGLSYEQIHRAEDRQSLPPVGRAVQVGGRRMDIDCSGAARATVIFQSGAPWPLLKDPRTMFESGGPHPGYSWVSIQRQAARFARACWYDSAGSGWSDLGPYPRDSASQARDLHAVLSAAASAPPYVLVAEASAALDARVFTGFYPSEVSGLVLIDGVHPDFFARTRPRGDRMARLPGFVGHSQDMMAQVFNLIGFYRLGIAQNQLPPAPKGITVPEWTTIWRLTRSPKTRAALMQDIGAWPLSAAEARAAGTLGDRPLRVISSANDALQTDLAGLSTRGRQIIAGGSPGDLIYRAPDLIVEAIRQVVAESR